MADGRAGPVGVQLAHVTAGRARLRLAGRLPESRLAALADGLAALPDIDRVVIRPATGSVIVEGRLTADALEAALRSSGLVSLAEPEPAQPIGQMAQLGLWLADLKVQEQTRGALDIRTALALILLGGAIVQLMRGQISGPATALALEALKLIDRPNDQ
jgi:hypothetical protein